MFMLIVQNKGHDSLAQHRQMGRGPPFLCCFLSFYKIQLKKHKYLEYHCHNMITKPNITRSYLYDLPHINTND